MKSNKRIQRRVIKRSPDVRGQINAATQAKREQFGEEVTPEEIQTFKELYDEVKEDFGKNPSMKKDVKSNFVHQTSQGVIFALAIACIASAADKFGYGFADYIANRLREENNILETEPNDPMLNSDPEMNFPSPE